MNREELDRYARIQAEDAVRYVNPPVDAATITNIAEHIRVAWLDGFQAGKISEK